MNEEDQDRDPERTLLPGEASPPVGGMSPGNRGAEPHARAEILPPEFIGGYRILSKLGEGGMGVVYEAEQDSPRRRVAVKVVRGGVFVDEARVRLFRREAETLARLKHPNIATIYESGRTGDGRHFFAMELVQGETLDRHMARRGAVSSDAEVRFRLALFRTIADAVHYAHQRGVIHRDLKPSNVIVAEESVRDDDRSGPKGSMPGMRLPEIKIWTSASPESPTATAPP